jgi:GWxTD domain-containing protein
MKKSFLLTIALLWLMAGYLTALDASISYATFKGQSANYVEIYLHIIGNTAEFVPVADSSLQAAVDVIVLFKQGGQIIKFDKYRLNSPVFKMPADFVDLKRYALDNGEYEIDVSIEDLNRPDNARRYTDTFMMDYENDGLGQSDIQLLASITPVQPGQENNPMVKNGYYFESLPFHFYGKNAATLTFYNELYNTDKAIGEDFMVSNYIDNMDTPDKTEALQVHHKRKSPEPVSILLQQIDISALPSGNYSLVIEVRNRSKELLSKKAVLFQRSNPYLKAERETIAQQASLENEFVAKLTEDELRYSLKAIYMQVDASEGELMNTLIREKNRQAMQMFLFSYWATQNPTNPEAAYEAYMNVARKIDERYRSGFGYGFETDRGYIFMKYGAPNDIVSVEDEPSAPPYEIWFYNQFPATRQNNVKFLFYNPSLATNGHRLLHATARGEINNPRWEVELYRNAPNEIEGDDYRDGTRMQRNVNRQARRLFENY